MIFYAGGPLWLRIVVIVVAVIAFCMFAWRYYTTYWRGRR